MKYGLDIHGVCDTKTKFFAIFSQRAIANGHECHIITGSQRTKANENFLKDLGIQYTHFFSISDYLLKEGCVAFWKDKDNPFFSEEVWNDAKANYCKRNKVDIHFDDSDEYGKFFTTLYMRVI